MTFRLVFEILLVVMTLLCTLLLVAVLFVSPTELFANVDTPPEQLEKAWSRLTVYWAIVTAVLAGLSALVFKPWKKK